MTRLGAARGQVGASRGIWNVICKVCKGKGNVARLAVLPKESHSDSRLSGGYRRNEEDRIVTEASNTENAPRSKAWIVLVVAFAALIIVGVLTT